MSAGSNALAELATGRVAVPDAQALSARSPELERLTQYRVIHGYRRAFVHVGSGPAVLFIHGIGNSLDSWAAQIADLSRDHTVVAPDLLGHGRSDRPRADYSIAAYANAMRDLLSVLDIEHATVVGHSLGGGVATQFAYQFPERCERLVLVSSGGVSRSVHPALRMASAPGSEHVLALLGVPAIKPVARAFFRALRVLDDDLAIDAPELLSMFDSFGDHTTRQAFTRTLRAVVDRHGQVVTMLDRCYLTQGMPTLLVWGRRDAVIPLDHALAAHEAMPGSRLVVFDEAGHFPHHADSARFCALLREHLATTQPASYSKDQWRALLRRGRPLPPTLELSASAARELGVGRN